MVFIVLHSGLFLAERGSARGARHPHSGTSEHDALTPLFGSRQKKENARPFHRNSVKEKMLSVNAEHQRLRSQNDCYPSLLNLWFSSLNKAHCKTFCFVEFHSASYVQFHSQKHLQFHRNITDFFGSSCFYSKFSSARAFLRSASISPPSVTLRSTADGSFRLHSVRHLHRRPRLHQRALSG